MDKHLNDFKRFMKEREAAALAFTNGDGHPVARLATHESPSTFFHPRGGHKQGPNEVISSYEKDAKAFEPGGESRLEILQMGAGDSIAYWVGYQHATAKMHGKPEPIPMTLRITEIFRREGEHWKLVHRHADTLSEHKEPNEGK
jgi:ketosteroid isomerase-like protein